MCSDSDLYPIRVSNQWTHSWLAIFKVFCIDNIILQPS